MIDRGASGSDPPEPPEAARAPAVDVAAVDAAIARIDAALSAQANAILHHPLLRGLEAAWRSLQFLVDRTEFGANIQIEIFPVTKAELLDDLQRGEARSRLHDIVRRGTFERGEAHPYALLVVDHAFGACEEDLAALERLATLAAHAHAQCLAAPEPSLLGLTSWRELPAWCRRASIRPGAADAAPATEGYVRWRALRQRDESLHVSLCLPRFQLRPRYGAATAPTQLFPFEETAGEPDGSPLWGSAVLLAASAICDGFAAVGWPISRLRHRARLPDTGSATATGGVEGSIPGEVECPLTERGRYVLSEAGLSHFDAVQRESPQLYAGVEWGSMCWYSNARSVQPPYLFLYLAVARCVHAQYLAGLRRGDAPAEVERALDAWLGRFDRKRLSTEYRSLVLSAMSFQCAEVSFERGPEGERIAQLRLNLSHDSFARPYLHTWSLSSGHPGPVRALALEAAHGRFDTIARAWRPEATEASDPTTRGEIERCWQAFRGADQAALSEGRPARWLGLQIQCAILLGSTVAPPGSSPHRDAWWYERPLLAWPGAARVEIVSPEHRALGWWPTLGEPDDRDPFAIVGDGYGARSPCARADLGYLLRIAAVFGSPLECSMAWPRLVDRAGHIGDPRARAETLAFLECSRLGPRLVDRAGRIGDPGARERTLAFLAGRLAARAPLDAQVLSLATSLAAAPRDSAPDPRDAAGPAHALLARVDAVAACVRWLPDDARRSVLDPLLTETLALRDNMYREPRALVLEGLHLLLTSDLRERALCAAEAADPYYARGMLRALACGADASTVERIAASLERIRVGGARDLLHVSRARRLPRALVDAMRTADGAAPLADPEQQRKLALERQLLQLHADPPLPRAALDGALDDPFLLPLLAAELPGDLWPRALDALDARWGLSCLSVMARAGRGGGPLSREGALADLLVAIAPHVPEAHWQRVRGVALRLEHPAMRLAVLLARLLCTESPPPLRLERLVDLLRVGADAPRVFLLNALVACVEVVRDLTTDDGLDGVGHLVARLVDACPAVMAAGDVGSVVGGGAPTDSRATGGRE